MNLRWLTQYRGLWWLVLTFALVKFIADHQDHTTKDYGLRSLMLGVLAALFNCGNLTLAAWLAHGDAARAVPRSARWWCNRCVMYFAGLFALLVVLVLLAMTLFGRFIFTHFLS